MRITAHKLIYCGLILAIGCGEQDDDSRALSRGDLASASEADDPAPTSDRGDLASTSNTGWVGEFSDDSPDEPPPPELECGQGGSTDAVRVVFRCDEITVETCKDLSNVVVEYEDGSRQRFDGQTGHVNVFAGDGDHGGASITRVWVKAGANHSGEGPGYGERFDAPTTSCVPSEVDEPESPVTGI
jgi:hypothetical protein